MFNRERFTGGSKHQAIKGQKSQTCAGIEYVALVPEIWLFIFISGEQHHALPRSPLLLVLGNNRESLGRLGVWAGMRCAYQME